jgi:hypothetical protein
MTEPSNERVVNWVDYINLLLAFWLAAAPWVLQTVRKSIRLENALAALALLSIATFGIVRRTPTRLVAASGLACGVWILSGPWVMGYADRNPIATINEVWIGFLVTLFAAVRLSTARHPNVD